MRLDPSTFADRHIAQHELVLGHHIEYRLQKLTQLSLDLFISKAYIPICQI